MTIPATPDLNHPDFRAFLRTSLGLTSAETDVALVMAEGQVIKQCARTLKRSTNTIKAQRRSMFKRLEIGGSGALIALVYRAYIEYVSTGSAA